jgi:hypothetical protein
MRDYIKGQLEKINPEMPPEVQEHMLTQIYVHCESLGFKKEEIKSNIDSVIIGNIKDCYDEFKSIK